MPTLKLFLCRFQERLKAMCHIDFNASFPTFCPPVCFSVLNEDFSVSNEERFFTYNNLLRFKPKNKLVGGK